MKDQKIKKKGKYTSIYVQFVLDTLITYFVVINVKTIFACLVQKTLLDNL